MCILICIITYIDSAQQVRDLHQYNQLEHMSDTIMLLQNIDRVTYLLEYVTGIYKVSDSESENWITWVEPRELAVTGRDKRTDSH